MLPLRCAQPLALRPGFRQYAWGDERFIPELFSLQDPLGPYAEAWLGAHPSLPARAVLDGSEELLDMLLERRPDFLGDEVLSRFAALPYLLKVLSASRPLSIQVHPTRAQARAGFRRESDVGVALESPLRNYRDIHHKPELLVALTDFHAIVGFRPLDEIGRVMLELPEARAALSSYSPTQEGLRTLVQEYFALPVAVQHSMSARLLERLRSEDSRLPFRLDEHAHWALLADREFSRGGVPDRGVFLVFLMNLVHLGPGEGVFVGAGVPHAYLRGSGIEVMASSDNVLRAGLTPKHVDIPELMKIVAFRGSPPQLVFKERSDRAGESVYKTTAQEFELRRVDLEPRVPWTCSARGPEVLLIADLPHEANVEVRSSAASLTMGRGGACLIPCGLEYVLCAESAATVYRATVPPASTSRS